MSRETKKREEEEMPMAIRLRARCGRDGKRVSRRFRPDSLLDRLTGNPFPRKSVFTCRTPSFKDAEGRKYYRAAPMAVRATEKKFTDGWYYLVLPVRRSIEDEKVTWPVDGAVTVETPDRLVRVRISDAQRPINSKCVVARVFLEFE
jgi:hypothetical protein